LNYPIYTLTSPVSQDDFEKLYQFRWEQLRKPLNFPQGSERDSLDNTSFHCMAVDENNTVIGAGSIQPCEVDIMRIRYMAVHEQYQRLGIGRSIVENLLTRARKQTITLCWLNARANAVAFYQALGFDVMSEVDAGIAIAHFRMEVKLTS